MHLDFIPVTEEEAGTAGEPGTAPTDVDKTDVAAPELDTCSDLWGETEELTILMDEDSGAETMPAEEVTMVTGAEDETMVSRTEAETLPSEAEAETMPAEAEAETISAGGEDETMVARTEAETLPSEAEAETMPAEAEAETMSAGAEAETMAVEDEAETMVWSRSDPFLDSPFRTGSKTGTGAPKETESVTPRDPEQDIFTDQEKGAGAESDQAFSIPDHVLTPTLADIYYQQGQPRLALQIFRRLLDADPDNERIAKRIREIEAGLNADIEPAGVEETVVTTPTPRGDVKPPAQRVKPKVDKKKKAAAAEKPLSGVRIRKKAKTRRRKTR